MVINTFQITNHDDTSMIFYDTYFSQRLSLRKTGIMNLIAYENTDMVK